MYGKLGMSQIKTPVKIGSLTVPSFLPITEEDNLNYNPQFPKIFRIKGNYFVSFSLKSSEIVRSM